MVVLGALAQNEGPQQRPLRQVERRLALPLYPAGDLGRAHPGLERREVVRGQIQQKRRPDRLTRPVGGYHDTQRFVASHDAVEGGAQRLDAQRAVELEYEALVVGAVRLATHRRGRPDLRLRLGQRQPQLALGR